MSRSETRERAAKALEDKLRQQGHAYDADTIAQLHRSLNATRGTLRTLHADNMRLRRQLGLPTTHRETPDGQA